MRVTWLGLVLVVCFGGFASVGCGNVDVKNFCAPQLTRCADSCVDTMGDPANCGACGNACGAGQACVSGACTCTGAGGMFCGGACVDTQTDTANCGTCGTTCAAGEACSAGTCTATCGMPYSACTDATSGAMYCADLTTDPSNCGTCGNVCPTLQRCSLGTCAPSYGWEPRAMATPNLGSPGSSDHTPAGESSYYLIEGNTLSRYDRDTDMFTMLAAPPIPLPAWTGIARVGNALWAITSGEILEYDIATNTWTAVIASGVHPNPQAGTTHDASGKIYTLTNEPLAGGGTVAEVAIYDTVAGGSVTYVSTTIESAITYSEPHLVFDEGTNLLYISPNFTSSLLYSFDPATSMLTSLAPNPGGQMNDIFCGDRNGRIFAAGTTNSSDPAMYTYDIKNNVWMPLPPLPYGHGDSGACTVMEDDGGYLYVETGFPPNTARLRLH